MNAQNWTLRSLRSQTLAQRRVPFAEPAPTDREAVVWVICAISLGALLFAALAS